MHQPAAHGLCAQQHRVEHGTTGVGVDLDELRALWGDVKVVAHEHAQRAMVFLRNRPRTGQYLLRPGGQGERALQGRHGVLDHLHRGLRGKHCSVGKQVRMGVCQRAGHIAQPRIAPDFTA